MSSTSSDNGAPGSIGKSWLFTVNNPQNLKLPEEFKARFCIWQLERGEQGTPHLQGYAYFSGNKRLSALKKLAPTAHWEIRRGTHEQAKTYCSKTDTRVDGPWQYGDEPKQGTRQDLISVKKRILEGASELEIADEFFSSWTKNYRAFREYRLLSTPPRTIKTVVVCLFGPPGVGKTSAITRHYPDAYWLVRPTTGTNLWFDGYCQHRVLVIDEFYGWIPFDFLLRLCDHSPLQVQTKGGTVPFNSHLVIFTSNKHPGTWYHYEKFPNGYKPLERRIEFFVEVLNHSSYRLVHSSFGDSPRYDQLSGTYDFANAKSKLAELRPEVLHLPTETSTQTTPQETSSEFSGSE